MRKLLSITLICAALSPVAAMAELAPSKIDGYELMQARQAQAGGSAIARNSWAAGNGWTWEASIASAYNTIREGYRDGTTVKQDDYTTGLKMQFRAPVACYELRPWATASTGVISASLVDVNQATFISRGTVTGYGAGTTLGMRFAPYSALGIEPLTLFDYDAINYNYSDATGGLLNSKRQRLSGGGGLRVDWRPASGDLSELWVQGVALTPIYSKTSFGGDIADSSQKKISEPEFRLELGSAYKDWSLTLTGTQYTAIWKGGSSKVVKTGLQFGRRF